jgi:hypothetical protein
VARALRALVTMMRVGAFLLVHISQLDCSTARIGGARRIKSAEN